MIKIAFIGCDSTHTEAYAKLFNLPKSPYFGKALVCSIFGEDIEQAKYKAKNLKIPKVAESIDSALENVDLVMIIGRFGESHYLPATLALKKKIPVFVDKPFTVNIKEARNLSALANELNVKLCSSSPLRFASEVISCKEQLKMIKDQLLSVNVTVPANCTDLGSDPRLNNSFFYGIHGIEVLLELTGYDLKKIDYHYHESQVKVILTMKDNKNHVLNLINDVCEFYWFDIHTKLESFHYNINLDESYYKRVAEFLITEFIKGTSTIPLKSTLLAISILDEIEKNNPFKNK